MFNFYGENYRTRFGFTPNLHTLAPVANDFSTIFSIPVGRIISPDDTRLVSKPIQVFVATNNRKPVSLVIFDLARSAGPVSGKRTRPDHSNVVFFHTSK